MTSNDEQLKIINAKIKNVENLKAWLSSIHDLKNKYVSKFEITDVRDLINLCDIPEIKLSKIINIYDKQLWKKRIFGYKMDKTKLAEIDKMVTLLLETHYQELTAFIELQNKELPKDNFRIELSNEVSKQFTLVSTTNIITVLMKKVTDDFNIDSKIIFIANCILMITILIFCFNYFINNEPWGSLLKFFIFFMILIFLILNGCAFYFIGNYDFSYMGVLFLSAFIALYFSVAINSLAAFNQNNNHVLNKRKIGIVIILILVLELIFFVSLFNDYLKVAVKENFVLHLSFFNMFL